MNFFIVSLIKIVLVFAIFMTTLAYLQWVERKVLAHIQSRTGPLRVGPHGLMQPLADVFKLLTKEDLLPPYVNRFFYLLAPFIAVCLALISISIIPFGPEIDVGGTRTYMQISDVNVGILVVGSDDDCTLQILVLGVVAPDNWMCIEQWCFVADSPTACRNNEHHRVTTFLVASLVPASKNPTHTMSRDFLFKLTCRG